MSKHHDAVRAFADAIRADNPKRCFEVFRAVDEAGALGICIERALQLPKPSAAMRREFLQIWQDYGDIIRGRSADDLNTLNFLKVILPPYRGSGARLFRGDSLRNHQSGTYGPSWSTDLKMAESFATDMWQSYEGGSVVLETFAPAEAIICAVSGKGVFYEESEHIVDRRRLGAVNVIRRFAGAAPVRLTDQNA